MALVQQFIHPKNLDIRPPFQNESSWLLAQKELQKINMYKAPRDKLVCILNCCKVINNLLLNASIASDENPPGADEFLPVLIYVTIKANPPQLHSNLLYIQRYRRQSRLVSEAAYFFTNMLSAEAFISNIDPKALSMEESEFETNMESARALLSGLSNDTDSSSDQNSGNIPKEIESKSQYLIPKREKEPVVWPKKPKPESKSTKYTKDHVSIEKVPSLSELENKGAAMLLEEDKTSQVFRDYPYLFADVGDLTINDVEDLLNNYKQLVVKYVCLSKGLGKSASSSPSTNLQTQAEQHVEIKKEPEGHRVVELNKELHRTSEVSDRVASSDEKTIDSELVNEAGVLISDEKGAEPQLQSEVDVHQRVEDHEASN